MSAKSNPLILVYNIAKNGESLHRMEFELYILDLRTVSCYLQTTSGLVRTILVILFQFRYILAVSDI